MGNMVFYVCAYKRVNGLKMGGHLCVNSVANMNIKHAEGCVDGGFCSGSKTGQKGFGLGPHYGSIMGFFF